MIAPLGRFFKSIFIGALALFKRALCFLNRKRRDSGSILPTHIQDIDIPTQVLSNSFEVPPTIPTSDINATHVPDQVDAMAGDDVFTDWDNWDKPSPAVVESKPQQSSAFSRQPPVEEPQSLPEPDYFSDLGLAPTIQKQKKVLIKPAVGSFRHEPQQSSRLAFTPDLAAPLSAELEEWDESAGAWEDEDITLEAEQALRQSRKAERERRLAEHQKRNQEKEQRKYAKDSNRLATKLSVS